MITLNIASSCVADEKRGVEFNDLRLRGKAKQANSKGKFSFKDRYEDGVIFSFDFTLLVCEVGFL